MTMLDANVLLRVFERPLTTGEAEAAVSSWLALPAGLLHRAQVSGPLAR